MIVSTPTTNGKKLLPHHLAELRASGLSDDTIAAANIYSEEQYSRLRLLLNSNGFPKKCAPALVYSYINQAGQNGFVRIKCDTPRKRDNSVLKYEQPKGLPPEIYIPPGVHEKLDDASVPLFVTEGEKKSLKLTQEGFPTIGLGGVYGWKTGKAERLLPSLEAIAWKGRKVFVVFDSDIKHNPNVQDGAARLAMLLQNRGAIVKLVRLPDGPAGDDGKPGKVGVDDFLVANPVSEFHKLVNAAEDPEPPEGGKVKLHASAIDPIPEAKRFLASQCMGKGQLSLRYHAGIFYRHTGKKYVALTADEIRAVVMKWLAERFTFVNTTSTSHVVNAIGAECILSAATPFSSWLNGRNGRNYLACENGIVDIDAAAEGKPALLPHSPLWFSVVAVPYDYDPAADCPAWKQSLRENLERDTQRLALFQEFCGFCLAPTHVRDRLQHFMLMHGEGGTGKSSANAGLIAVLGEENVSHVPLELFGHRFQLFRTLGRLANVCSEIGELDKVAEGTLKQFTSGERQQFERKFADPIEAIPTAKLVLATNNLPRFSDKSGGIWRRMLLLPFQAAVAEEKIVRGMDSPHYWYELGEAAGMLNWALEGLARLRKQGAFTRSLLGEISLEEYRVESNPAKQFLEDHCDAEADAETRTNELYKAYREWAKENGYHPLSDATFGREVVRQFPKVTKKRTGGRGDRYHVYAGLYFTGNG